MAECSFDRYPSPVPILHRRHNPGVLDETHGFANRSMDDTPQHDTPLSDNVRHVGVRDKDKTKASDSGPGACSLATLPAEILVSILSYLAPEDLGRVSGTCRVLYLYSTDDRLWRRHVQENVPGPRLSSPHPYATFRELYAAHDPHWFLPKYKFWFSDAGLPGRIIITRYNPADGSIEGFQLICQNVNTSFHTWHAPGPSIVSGFSPSLYLYYQIPALRIPGRPPYTAAVHTCYSEPTDSKQSQRGNGFEPEILINPGPLANYKSSFTYARSLSSGDLAARTSPSFPHSHVWPSPHIASGHRVLGAGLSQAMTIRPEDRARSRREVCDKAFRIHKWLPTHHLEEYPAAEPGSLGSHFVSAQSGGEATRPNNRPASASLKLGEEVATYSTLDPAQYTPTPTRPFRGLFVGDYGGHGCEIVWIDQPDADTPPPTLERHAGETDAAYAARRHTAAVYHGRLEGIKLTGDANVPRGEHTFVVEDLGEAGFVREETKDPFKGARVVKSRAHIANNGFQDDRYMDGELIMISHDLLAHNWLSLGHVSYLRRVDIDRYVTEAAVRLHDHRSLYRCFPPPIMFALI